MFNQGLPPGQHEVVIMVPMPPITFGYPEISKDLWQLKVYGEVKNPLTWNWLDFNRLPQKDFEIDFHCVTSWSKLGQNLLALISKRLSTA